MTNKRKSSKTSKSTPKTTIWKTSKTSLSMARSTTTECIACKLRCSWRFWIRAVISVKTSSAWSFSMLYSLSCLWYLLTSTGRDTSKTRRDSKRKTLLCTSRLAHSTWSLCTACSRTTITFTMRKMESVPWWLKCSHTSCCSSHESLS